MPGLVDGAAFEAVSAGELFGVGEAIEFDRAQAVVVEQRLPLAHHAEIAVVHHDDLDGQGVRGDGGQFGDRHLEAAVAADGEDQLIGTGHLRADGGGKAEAHGAESAGVDPEARLVEADQLRGPHLVLADVGSDDGLAAGEAVDFVHQVLRLDFVFGAGAIVGMLVLPGADLRPPLRARGFAFFGLNSGSSSCTALLSFCSTRLTSPTMGISGTRFLPISAGSISTWMTRAWRAKAAAGR